MRQKAPEKGDAGAASWHAAPAEIRERSMRIGKWGDSDRLGGRDADGQNTAGEKQREDNARSDAQEQQEARRAAR